ncbi:helix-turn-helix transcriptional regulator [Microbacterium horticulturae]|uniref:Helix-turn-helix transcriptional regulator n=1 Tax=Microbacterium horticulturae TaxID=3028316 RepID=A0ABY8C0H7_9MICO|nr:helix-turn-helix transcriptional regulator [Microbacterium sp. KACC 23027]WEG08842.1 helix-turn-helix transcriptional regulator [Microbacterium sp. KACC 23027]
MTATYESADEVLAAYRPVMHAIAAAGGPSCEVVLHNLDGADVDLRHTIMAIENGHVTGRAVGGPSTSLGLNVVKNRHDDHDAFGYRGFTADGRELRCSSVYFRNGGGDIVASLCINLDLSAMQQARTLLDALLPTPEPETPTPPDEHIGRDLVSVMDAMIGEAIADVGRPVAQMSRDDKIGVLQRLDASGATQMRKSVETIAVRLGISRVTAYAYLDEARRAGV